MTKEELIKQKAEELFTHYDNLLAIDLTLDGSVPSREITEYVKNCCRKVCNEMITEADEKMKFWYAVRKEIESSELYKD